MQPSKVITLEQMEQINQITLALYETSQPFHTRISNFFQSVMDIVYFDKASLLLFYQDEAGQYRKKYSITLNWDAALLEQYDRYLYRFDDTLAPVDVPYPVLLRSSSFFHEQKRRETEFWNQYQIPSNAEYELFGNVLLNPAENLRCKLCLARNTEAGDFSLMDVRLIRLFQPHLSKITAASQAQPPLSVGKGEFENYNCIGYCMIDSNRQISHANDTFSKLDRHMEGRLAERAIDLCKNFQTHSGDSLDMLSYEYKFDNAPLFLEITCSGDSAGADRQYHCMVYDLSHFFSSTLLQLKSVYQLSSREYEIFVCILQGLKNEEIAKKLFLSVPSIKKYISSIFDKMGITNQKQIFAKLNIF